MNVVPARGAGHPAETTITYSSGGRVSQVTRTDSGSESLQPFQGQGLVPAGQGTPGNPAAPVLAVQAQASYTDPRQKTWKSRLDWAGYGVATQTVSPLGHTAVTVQ